MNVSMDLNASPEPEEDAIFEPSLCEDSAPEEKHSHHHHLVEHVETAADIMRRECEERKQRMKRERPDEKPKHQAYQPMNDYLFHAKSQRTYDKSRLPLGWLDCPTYGQEIGCIVPSKVPLGECFNDCIVLGKRYSFRQVIHQQRVLGRKYVQLKYK